MKTAHLLPRPLRGALTTLMALVACAASLEAADANPPARLTYQGYLTDGDGVALATNAPKNYNVVFRMFNTQTGGTSLWSEQQTLTVDKGYFSVLLGEGAVVGSGGSQEPRPALGTLFSAADASDRFVEVTVLGIGSSGGDVTILPRLRLLTSPYAFLSKHSITAGSLVNSTNSPVITVSGDTISMAHSLVVAGKISTSGGGAEIDGNVTTTGAFVGPGTIPLGGIIMWSGNLAAIPSGWALCNGQNGTPNLTDRFIVGAGAKYTPGNTGGNVNGLATLTLDNLPKHSHQIVNTWQHHIWSGWAIGDGGSVVARGGTDTTETAGNSSPVLIMPPYYALAYIMRIQ